MIEEIGEQPSLRFAGPTLLVSSHSPFSCSLALSLSALLSFSLPSDPPPPFHNHPPRRYALTGKEVVSILMQRLVKVDGKVRTDATYPAGLMDVVSLDRTDENFRLVYDTKGRFVCHRVGAEEAGYKLLRVKKLQVGAGGVPYITTHDGRTLRYPDPDIKVNDTVVFEFADSKVTKVLKFDVGQLAMVVGGRNQGRIGTVVHREKHKGSFDIVQVRDAAGHEFATRLSNVFVIGDGDKPMISLPKGKGIRLNILEEAAKREAVAA